MRIVFAGTGGFGVPSLRKLVEQGLAPVLVVSQPDRPAGRGRRTASPPIAAEARVLGLPLFQPERLHAPESMARLEAAAPDVMVVVAFGRILRRRLLDLPRLGCLNVHGSRLPRHRGASPVQAAILAGDATTGVTVMHMDEGLDTGPILLQEETDIGPQERAGSLHDRLAALGAPLLLQALEGLASGTLEPRPQGGEGATTCGSIRKEEGLLDWTRGAGELARRVRAFHPWPGAYTFAPVRGQLLRTVVERAEVAPGSGPPGTILVARDDRLLVASAENALSLRALKPAGRRTLEAAAFLRGYPVEVGARMGSGP